jgi:PTH1 family peptidyl-tRNA hydrolase
MKLVVGLGNPGHKYAGTRHNIGFDVLAELGRKHGGSDAKSRFHGEVVEVDLAGQKSLLLTPTTFMNLSGTSVLAARDFYKIPLEDILVVCDDLNLPAGKLRVRAAGSAGGQKGLEDIIRRLGSQDFARLRIGIGSAPPGWAWPDYVLGKFTEDELPLMLQAIDRACQAVVVWANDGTQTCMNRFNVSAKQSEE